MDDRQAFGGTAPGIPSGTSSAVDGEALGERRVVHDPANRRDEGVGTVLVDEEARLPGSTSVVRPPTAAATTGVPQAAASRATRPNDSERLGTRQMSAAR